MLLLFVGALLLMAVSICIGYSLLAAFQLSGDNLFESAFESYWLGLSVLLIAASAAVCIAPVGRFGTPLLIAAGAATLAGKPIRHFWAAVGSHVTAGRAVIAAMVLLSLSLLQVVPEALPDTGFYHYQIIRWYSEYGAVPGLALLHCRLGFHSGMFAIAAMFDHGLGLRRAGSIVNLASACLCLWFAGWKLHKALSAPGVKNFFWPVCLLLLASGLETTLISTYPDTLLALFIPAIFWIAWEWRDQGLGARASWLLILLGAASMAVKVSGVFLLIACCALSVFFSRISIGAVVTRIALSLLLISPVLCVQAITSGHPLYPMASLAIPVNWAAPNEMVTALREMIRLFPLIGYDHPRPVPLWEEARILFLGPRPSLYGAAALTLASLWFLWRERKPGFAVFLAIASSGIAFVQLLQVPAPRFTWGFIVILPALLIAGRPRTWIAGVCLASAALLYVSGPNSNRLDELRLLVYVAIIVSFAVGSRLEFSLPTRPAVALLIAFQFIRPMAIAAGKIPFVFRDPGLMLTPQPVAVLTDSSATVLSGDVVLKEAGDGFGCWAENPPCAPSRYQANFLLIDGLRFRCADKRLSCGFTFDRKIRPVP